MFSIVNAYHDVLVYQVSPKLDEIAITVGVAFVLMLLGLFMFRRAAPEMVDSL
jgi:lipopolysaccharide transport system permease protein